MLGDITDVMIHVIIQASISGGVYTTVTSGHYHGDTVTINMPSYILEALVLLLL